MNSNSYELSPLSHAENPPPETRRRCIIRHDSLFKATWDWFVLVLVIYIAIETPYSASFVTKDDLNLAVWDRIAQVQVLELINLLVDVMFLVDIVINFRTTYVEKVTENVIDNPKKIAINYLKTWFVIDFVAGIPFDYILSDVAEVASMAGLLKTARLLRLVRVSRKLDRYSEYGFAVVFLLTALLCLMSHWMACAWHAIGVRQLDNPNSWLVLLGDQFKQTINASAPESGPNAAMRYVTSLYFVLTSLTSIGFGNVAPNTYAEKIFSIVTMLVGAFIYGVIFGNLTAIIQRLYSSSAQTMQHLRVIKEFTESYEVPPSLLKILSEYVTQDQAFPADEEIKNVLPRLPESLQADIRVLLHNQLFTKFHVQFRAVSDSSRRALVAKMKTEHLLQGHWLLREGDQVDKLYFIVSGTVHVMRNGLHVHTIDGHGVVGCHPRFAKAGIKSKCSLEAQLATVVYHVTCQDVLSLATIYSDLQELFYTLPNVKTDLGITLYQKEPSDDCYTSLDTTEEIPLLRMSRPCPATRSTAEEIQVGTEERLEKRIAAIEQNVNEILVLLRQQTIKQNTIV